MKRLFITLISCCLLCSCSENNDNEGFKDTSGLVGTWELTKKEGYEIDGNNRRDWTDKDADYSVTYVFDCGNTGKFKYFDGSNGQSTIKWEYNSGEKLLKVTDIETNDVSTYKVNSISATTLVLIEHIIQSEYDYEYYNKETYSKK